MAVGDLYEVRCYQCEVSFPPGTKKCLHCGGRIANRRRQVPPAPVMRTQGEQPIEFFPDLAHSPSADKRFGVPELDEHGEDEPAQSTPRRAIRLGVNVLWIFGALMITLAQMCRGGG